MNVSAGELLGRTHEELVLLLIQLRRQSAHTLQAIENYYNEIDTIQVRFIYTSILLTDFTNMWGCFANTLLRKSPFTLF